MAIVFLDTVDFSNVPVENLSIQVVTSNPSWTSADEGRLIYNSTAEVLYYGSSTAWVEVGSGIGNVLNTLTLTAGDGLTGGGDLSANRTFDVGAGTGISVAADAISFDTTFGDGRYATLSGATFTGDISLGTVQLKQGSGGLGDPTGMTASMWKSALTSAGVTADGVYIFEDGSIAAQITAGGRLHVAVTQGTGLYKVETSSADNTYHAATEYGPSGVALWLNNSGGFPTQGTSLGQSPTVRGNLTIDGTVTLNTEPSNVDDATTKAYVDTADAGKADTTTTISAGTGLTGGGDLSANRSLAVDTTWGDARYATLSGATFTGNVNVDTLVATTDITTDGIFVVAAGVADMGGNRVQGVATPTAGTDAANKSYVDITAQGLSVKAPVVAIATTNITLSGAQTIDGVSVVADDRVLVAGQTDPIENGIYVAAAGAWTRATDADASGEIKDGSVLWVEAGTASGDALYVCTATGSDPWVPGTDSSTWTKYTSISDLTAGDGLTKTGTTLAVGAGTGITVNADDVAIDTSVVARKYSTDIGDGAATSIAVTHNLGTKDVIVQVRANGDDSSVIVPWVSTSTSVATLSFATAPASNAYRVTVLG